MTTDDLLPVSEAQGRLLANVSPVSTEIVPLSECLFRILADDVVSQIFVPPFANSAMDGFALRSEDTRSETETVSLDVVAHIQAGGGDSVHLEQGQAARIMTGAPMPAGADTVVPFEEATSDGGTVRVRAHRDRGSCVRPAGLDVKPGDSLLTVGTRLGPAHIALAASVGTESMTVYRRPTVAILATGDELVEPGTPLRPGQIYNSNAYGLAAAVRELGAEPLTLKPARDDAEALRETFRSLPDVDLILTSGGVSVGDFDYVKQVIDEIGEIGFWRVRMRPGKPLMFGSIGQAGGSATILGLPGNPTSTMVTFYVFARPLLLSLMGHAHPVPSPVTAMARDDLDNRGGRETFFRVVLSYEDGTPVVRLAGGQDSSMLLPLARANGLARVPAEVDYLAKDNLVEVIPI